jgi:hypothetical protein
MILDRIIPCAAAYDMWFYKCSECTGVFTMVEACTTDRGSAAERRIVTRHAVTTPATIALHRRTIACTVRDVSATGAGLSLGSRSRLPKKITLMTAGSVRPCRAVWRRGTQLGIAFDLECIASA